MEQEFDFERLERALAAAREASNDGDHSLWCEIPLPPDGVLLGEASGAQIEQAAAIFEARARDFAEKAERLKRYARRNKGGLNFPDIEASRLLERAYKAVADDRP